MLTLQIPPREFFDEGKQEFINFEGCSLQMEHSLISLSEWEAKWKKPFLNKPESRTNEELLDYFRCMTITKNVDPLAFKSLTQEHINTIVNYINDPMTATWFSDDDSKKPGRPKEIVTSELIYYWMIAQNIPFECRKWHLNRLLTLIRVCNVKNNPPKKMSKADIARRQRELNEQRKKKLGTKG